MGCAIGLEALVEAVDRLLHPRTDDQAVEAHVGHALKGANRIVDLFVHAAPELVADPLGVIRASSRDPRVASDIGDRIGHRAAQDRDRRFAGLVRDRDRVLSDHAADRGREQEE